MNLLLGEVDMPLLASATLAAFAGILAGRIGIEKVTIGFIQQLVETMLLTFGILLMAGII